MTGSREHYGALAGKVAAVTGATSGSGRAIARLFANEGANVVLLARGQERLDELAGDLGDRAVGIATDVGNAASVRAAFAAIESRFGRLDILINNAAVYRPCPFELLSDEEIAAQVTTNMLGPIYTARAAIPLMRSAGGGEIVNTSSEATIETFPFFSIYAATKAGLERLGTVLSSEYEKEDIRVTTLIQGCAFGEGSTGQGNSADWQWNADYTDAAVERWTKDGTLDKIMGVHGGQQVDDVAAVHLFVVTRPRGQKLDVIRCRSY